MDQVIAAKVEQAVGLLREFNVPLWIVQFARETGEHPEPVQNLAVGMSVTWPAAFIISDSGETIAIVGTGDVSTAEGTGAYADVIGYVRDVGPPLREVLARFDPARIAVSFSRDDDSADNLTHGMYLKLLDSLQGTPFVDRLISAEEVLGALRARKLPAEVARIREAIGATAELFGEIEEMLAPGVSEREIAERVRRRIDESGLGPAWDPAHDPIVNFGPGSRFGHVAPGDTALAAGMLVHVDLGVKTAKYCSDLQRTWYVPRAGEDHASAEVQRAFDTVLRSMQQGFSALRPGVRGWEVDAAARAVLTDAGYPEPEFAFGHQLGQLAHDGGSLLGPRWPRYGDRPNMRLEEGNVFTLEFALATEAGTIGLEEDVLVTLDGAEYLSTPQESLQYVR